MNAVLRAITKLPEIRDRSVVRSSVIPSAKYSWSGSFDRLAKGRTTIDSRGADFAAGADGLGTLAVTGAWTGATVELPMGHAHQTAVPRPIAATILATRTASLKLLRRLGPMGCNGIVTSGNDATAVALSA